PETRPSRSRAVAFRRGCRESPRRPCGDRRARSGEEGARGAAGRVLGRCGGDAVAVELEEVVGGGDQSPFRPAGGSPAALEASDLAVELDLAEDGLDGHLPLAVKATPGGRGEH